MTFAGQPVHPGCRCGAGPGRTWTRIRMSMYRFALRAARLRLRGGRAGSLVLSACRPRLAAQAPAAPAPTPTAPAPAAAGPARRRRRPSRRHHDHRLRQRAGGAGRAAAARQRRRSCGFSSRASTSRAGPRRSRTKPTCITSSSGPASRRRASSCPMDDAAEQTMLADFKALWATNFLEDLSIELDRVHVPERRGRRHRDLPHGGARAGQDRRLRGQQADRPHQDRRAAARARHRAAARLVPRRGRHPPGQDGAARDDGGEGLHQRRGRPQGRRRWPADPSW